MPSTNLKIEISEDSQVGEARRLVTEVCRGFSLSDTICGEAAIIVTELARNMVRHGGGGELLVLGIKSAAGSAVELLALDQGSGMENVADCLRDGHSTGGTAGTGLGAVKRLAQQFEIYSAPQRGTAIWAMVGGPKPVSAEGKAIFGGVSVPVRGETVCGDSWDIADTARGLRVLVADGLGHGPFAEDASREAVLIFRKYPDADPAEFLELAHPALKKTRGAAASIAEIQWSTGYLLSAGVGNVCMRVIHESGSKNLVSDNGTLGGSVRKMQQFSQPWKPGSLFIMHSDGLSTHWNIEDYPGLAQRHPSLIAGILYRDFRRLRDDATVVVVRHQI